MPLLLLADDIAGDDAPLLSGLGWGALAGLLFFGLLLRWLIPFGYLAWGLLTVIQGLSIAGFVGGLAQWGRRRGWAAAAVIWWVALEVARNTIPLGGFGWGLLGITQHGGGLLLPTARVLGVYGVSALCAALAVGLTAGVRALTGPPAVRGRRVRRAGAGLAAVLAVGGLLALVPPPAATARTIDIAGVQGEGLESSSAAGVNRLSSERIVQVATQMVEATRPLASDPPALTVWPENSLDADVTDPANEAVRAQLEAGLALVDGGPILAGGMLNGPRPNTLYNALLVADADGLTPAYLKRQPVPFGEYVPFRRFLEWFPPLQQIPRDVLSSPDGAQVIDVAGARIGGVICFENAFPHLVASQVRAGAEVLVVATNNAPFGRSAMPSQHLAQSQLRAVETGRHVLHAGVSGVSAFVDPHGRVTQRTEVFQAAVIRDQLPLVEADTIATRLGDAPVLTVLLTAALGVAVLLRDEVARVRAC